jgi:hypothetical protein
MAPTLIEQQAGVPANTPTSAWFAVPEGEVGQITNALSTIAHASNPVSSFRSEIDNTIESLKQTANLLIGQASAYTVIHATSAAQVYALQQDGGTPYPTKAAAQAQATASNRNVSQSGQTDSGINAIGDFMNKLSDGNVWIRVVEAILGGILIAVALAKLTGADNVIASAAKTAVKVVP